MKFTGERRPDVERLHELARLVPWNPFYTPTFVAAIITAEVEPWLLALTDGGRVVSGCTALVSTGRLGRRLSIQSVPDLVDPQMFWAGIQAMCRRNRITEIEIHSFASRSAVIPSLGYEQWRKARREFVLELDDNVRARFSANHRRNIKRAMSERTSVHLVTEPHSDAFSCHAMLIESSMQRRTSRGEFVHGNVGVNSTESYVRSGVGMLFQARRGEEVLSSMLVFRAERGAYYHSAGSSPTGMATGASHLLVAQVIETLKASAIIEFNLGGAGAEEEGLARFKAGFGASPRHLDAAGFFLGGALLRKTIGALRLLRDDPRALLRVARQ